MTLYFKTIINLFITVLVILTPYTANCQDDIIIGTAYDYEQLTISEQEIIKNSANIYFDKLIQKDVKGFWDLCHPKFKEFVPYTAFQETGLIIANMITNRDSIQFIDAKKVEYSTEPLNARFSTGGSTDKSNPTYLQFQTVANIKTQSLLLFKLNKKPLSKMITLKFGLNKSKYELVSFEINTTSINEKTAEYYLKVAKNLTNETSFFSQFLALNMAYRLSYLGKGTTTSQMLTITEKLQTLQKNTKLINEIKKWNINDSIYDIINLDFLETQNDITPNIIYISKKELGEKNTKEEAKVLFEYLKSKYPDLIKEFGQFMFTAYQEYPAIQTKQYKYFRVFIDINKGK